MSSVFFTGHMIDRPGRASARFPQSMVPQVTQRIAAEVQAADVTEGFASAASGGDILFLEATMSRGGRAHVTLPCRIDDFRKDCVAVVPGSDWVARFDRLLEKAASVEILGDQYASENAAASECCSRIMVGLAARSALTKGEQPIVLALWDGRPGDAWGGTHSIVQFCLQQGFKVRWMQDLVAGAAVETRELAPTAPGTSSAIRHDTSLREAPQDICAVVFADAVGFSKLRERDVPAFMRHYLGCAMQALQTWGIVPLVKNTWGDGLYLVFGSVRDAGLFALTFRDLVVSTNWQQLGIYYPQSVRIGMHAGPLYRIYDALLGQWSYTGAHVTHTARLEPSVDPGKVFASLAFVALAASERVSEFTCTPAGRRQLVKNAGEFNVFELLRTQPAP
jgi:class 3 adenylate cyclase